MGTMPNLFCITHVQCIYKQRIVLIPTQLSTCKNDVQLKNRLAVCVVTLLPIQTQERGSRDTCILHTVYPHIILLMYTPFSHSVESDTLSLWRG